MVTDPQTYANTHTHRQDRLQYTAPLSLARSVINLDIAAVTCTYVKPFTLYTYIHTGANLEGGVGGGGKSGGLGTEVLQWGPGASRGRSPPEAGAF